MALDFPANPVNGQVYDNFYYDATMETWRAQGSGLALNAFTNPIIINPTITNPTITNPIITDAVIGATATNATTVPLTVKGAASQSANLQEWKNSSGTNIMSVNSGGDITTSGRFVSSAVSGASRFYAENTSAASDQYLYLINGTNNTGSKAVHFVNSSTRTVDGGANAYVIRNDGGPLVLGNTSYDTTIYNKVKMPNQPAFRAYNVSGGTGQNLSFATSDGAFNGRNSGWNGSRFTAPVAGVYVFSFAILVGAGTNTRILFRINGTYSTQYGDTLESNYSSYTYAGMSMAFYLNVNDYVELYNEQVGVYGSSFGSFSGFYVG